MSLRRDEDRMQQDVGRTSVLGNLLRAVGFLCLLSLGVVLALGLVASARAAPGPTVGGLGQVDEPIRVYLDPSTVAMTRCGTIEMTVQVQAVERLWGVQYVIHFDPNLLEVVDANPTMAGIQIYPAGVFEGKATYQAANNADNVAGSITYGVMMINPQDEPFFGSGSLGRIVFRPKIQSQATSVVSFEESQCSLSRSDGGEILASWGPATVTKTVVCRQQYLFVPLLLRNRSMGS